MGSGKETQSIPKKSLNVGMALIEKQLKGDCCEKMLLVALTMHDRQDAVDVYSKFFSSFCEKNDVKINFRNCQQAGQGYKYVSVRQIDDYLLNYKEYTIIIYAPSWDNARRHGNIAQKYDQYLQRYHKQHKYVLGKIDRQGNSLTFK